MSKYIGIKLVDATEMKLGEYNDFKGWTIPEDENPNTEGYMVKYSGNYISWCPKEVFETNNLEVNENSKLPSGVSIGPKMVKDFIKSYEVIERDGKTTIVHATLVNGFKLTEASSCVDPSNYSKEIGTEICLGKIEDQIWGLLGFLLQTAFEGIK
ncbi:hypothetical protein H7E67_01210 [Clostridium gasigenes]|uniref:Gp49 family protein n=1 Tax=Clostridium gasigenes TaxID=94869 RepID=UPI0016263C14|nr:Gp49 family protein [Clostridium gasigenes]MBB6622038.1 hypothetical protein [Clostridium gasigenes]